MIPLAGASRRFVATICTVGFLSAPPLCAQSLHATTVIAYDDKGQSGGGIFTRANLLGAPDGNVCTLGVGGFVTLGFAVTIVDGPGADFLVAENPFFSGPVGNAFSEAAFVEVSSNGVDFARFPAGYYGAQVYPGPFGTVPVAAYSNLAGICPVVFGPTIDVRDVVAAGADAFDLADLRSDPLVIAGKVKLTQIKQVRIVDVVSGIDLDGRGTKIFDPSTGSADIDGVTVIHHSGDTAPSRPTVALTIPTDGNLTLTISHPAGLSALDPATFGISLYGTPLANPFDLLGALTLTAVTATGFTVRLGGTLPPGFLLRMSVSIADQQGHISGATSIRPG